MSKNWHNPHKRAKSLVFKNITHCSKVMQRQAYIATEPAYLQCNILLNKYGTKINAKKASRAIRTFLSQDRTFVQGKPCATDGEIVENVL